VPQFRRLYIQGGTYFFTLVTYLRRPIMLVPTFRAALRSAVLEVKSAYPFVDLAWVLLPDHMHTVWRLPPEDCDFPKRIGLLKRKTSIQVASALQREDLLTRSRTKRHELTIWQRRYWERWIRDEEALRQIINYIHRNPVKHGLVDKVSEWPFSTFDRYVGAGYYTKDWNG